MPVIAVKSLTLSHFRSHRTTRLHPDGRPVALFGPNGAGKTNVLEAVSLLSPGRGLRRATGEEMARRPESLGWKVRAGLYVAGRLHEVETAWEGTGARRVLLDGKPAPQLALGRVARVLWLVPAMDRLWIEGAEGRRRFLDRIALSFDPAHGDAVLTYDKAMRERNRLLREQAEDAHWYRAIEAQMAQAGARVSASRRTALERLARAAEGAETAFPTAELALRDDAPQDAGELAAAYGQTRGRDLAAGRTLIGPHRADLAAVYAAKGIPAAQCSTGEQKALLVSLVLGNARALAEDTGTAPILLLDEVAAHLDAGRRAALYAEIVALGAQAWMTGTGPELFEGLGDRAQRFTVTERDGVSEVKETAWR